MTELWQEQVLEIAICGGCYRLQELEFTGLAGFGSIVSAKAWCQAVGFTVLLSFVASPDPPAFEGNMS